MTRRECCRYLRPFRGGYPKTKTYLTDLDAKIGDADDGLSLARGFSAVTAKLPEVEGQCIVTNDLIQYTVAIDRLNERVSYLYQPFHPAVLNLIDRVIRAAHRHGKEVGMCGEMAGMREAAPLLLGLGLDEFSMAPPSAPAVRKVLAGTTLSSARSIAERALKCSAAEEVAALVHEG